MVTKAGQKRAARILSVLLSLTLVLILSAASVFAASSDPEGPGKEDPDTKLKLYEEAKKEAEEVLGESSDLDSAYESGIGVHQDPAVFEKNFVLTPAQKEIAIERCLDATKRLSDDMSDLEKYYMLALWENYSVRYDSEFWPGGYDFDHYSHQWDAYGVLEEHKGVCAGIAVTYAVLCHAADLPCKFVRCDGYLDHTINWIPDINGHSYYIDVTENSFFMSADNSWSFEPIDLKFSGIDEKDRPSDASFEYKVGEEGVLPAIITDFYDGKTGEGDFKPKDFTVWFNEFAMHQNTENTFVADYEEKGSGNGSTHASYTDFDKYPAQPYESRKEGITGIWFLNDFYEEPVTIEQKIRNKEFDEQLLIIDTLQENYACDTEGKSGEEVAAELKESISSDISSVRYFPSFEKGEVVPEATLLKEGTDYDVSVEYDETKNEAAVTLKGIGEYSGESRFTVKANTASVTKAPIRNPNLGCNGESQYLLSDKGKAENGEMQFAIGTKDKPTGEFSSEIPTATDAGVYYIWYKAAGNEGYYDSEPQRIVQPVTIEPVSVEVLCGEDKTIRVGDTFKVEPKTDPEMEVTFSFVSGDEDVVTVSEDGTVTGVKEGSTTITVSAELNNKNPNYAGPYETWMLITVIPEDAPMPGAVTYQNVSGDGNIWYRGSRDSSDFEFERSEDDDSTIDHFTGIKVDGKDVDEGNYTAESGSVIIRLKPSYLTTLALGKHTLEARFDDGNGSATAEFTIAEAEEENTDDEDDNGGGSKGSKKNVNTGDESLVAFWASLLGVSLIGLFMLFAARVRLRRKDR